MHSSVPESPVLAAFVTATSERAVIDRAVRPNTMCCNPAVETGGLNCTPRAMPATAVPLSSFATAIEGIQTQATPGTPPLQTIVTNNAALSVDGSMEGGLSYQTTHNGEEDFALTHNAMTATVVTEALMCMGDMTPILSTLVTLYDQLRHFYENSAKNSAVRNGPTDGCRTLPTGTSREEASTSTAAPRSGDGTDFVL
jgi:hypothetical protein